MTDVDEVEEETGPGDEVGDERGDERGDAEPGLGVAGAAHHAPPRARELRADLRHWRRGRADTKVVEALGDAYVALLASAMVMAAVGNAVWTVRQSAQTACTGLGCQEARTVLPWVTTALVLALVLGTARLFGPVFVSPAVGSWLMTAPVDRPALLRGRLLGTAGLAVAVATPVAAATAAVAGFSAGSVAAVAAATGLVALAAVAAAALGQSGGPPVGAALLLALGAAAWVGLLLLATDRAPVGDPPAYAPAWLLADLAAAALAAGLLALVLARLGRMRLRDVSAGGALAPGISGALATLDLALAFDVVSGHRWRRRGSVRVRRRGPTGPWAVVWLDVIRVRRSPRLLLAPAAGVVVPYAAERAGAGPLTLLLAGLVGFGTLVPLLLGLRVLTRTPSLLRSLPFPVVQTRAASAAVPAVVALAFAAAVAPACVAALGMPVADTVMVALAVGGIVLASSVRWMTGRPPDYTKPLISTPTGAVPTNLYSSVARGLDVLLLSSAPLLVAPSRNGAIVSLLVAGGVLAFLLGRDE